MNLTSAHRARAGGALLGQAIGDALGVPYEFGQPARGSARMIGGGLGPYAPGEWSDDTQMAICIAQVAATGNDLRAPTGQDRVARAFVDWRASGASDIGNLTSRVLRDAEAFARAGSLSIGGAAARAAARAATGQRAAGNGALMRTGVVGLVALRDRTATAEAARAMASLTHADERCVESCVLWSEAVRVAVTHGRLDLRGGLDLLDPGRRAFWDAAITAAETGGPEDFRANGFTVTALQAAWWAITHAKPNDVADALQLAIGIGHDTDTVAAIAGALLGARFGVPALPLDLVRRVHGWPGLRAPDLIRLSLEIATHKPASWPSGGSMTHDWVRPLGIPHPHAPGIILGTEADLAHCRELGITAVVSLSRIGGADRDRAGMTSDRHVETWLIDSEDPDDNVNLPFTLLDAARTAWALADSGERVLLHCVEARHRTPSVALVISALAGIPRARAEQDLRGVLPHDPAGLLWRTAGGLVEQPSLLVSSLTS